MRWFNKAGGQNQPEPDFREQRPFWSAQFRRRYIVKVFHTGFEESWPLTVFDPNTDREIGMTWLPLHNYHSKSAERMFMEKAREIIANWEDFKPLPAVEAVAA